MNNSNNKESPRGLFKEDGSTLQKISSISKFSIILLLIIPIVFVILALLPDQNNQGVPPGYYVEVPILLFFLIFSLYKAYKGLVLREYIHSSSLTRLRFNSNHKYGIKAVGSEAVIIGAIWVIFGLVFSISIIWLLFPYV